MPEPDLFLDAMHLMGRIQRRMSEVVGSAVATAGIHLNATQAMLLYNIARAEGEVSPMDLVRTEVYLGTNVSYNLNQLVRRKFVKSTQHPKDKRRIILALTVQGKHAADFVGSILSIYGKVLTEQVSTETLQAQIELLTATLKVWDSGVNLRKVHI